MVPMGVDLVKRRLLYTKIKITSLMKGWVTVRYSGCNGEEDTLYRGDPDKAMMSCINGW